MKKTPKSTSEKKYEAIRHAFEKARVLEGVFSLLHWDMETYMPPAAAPIRAKQMKILSGMIHEQKTSKRFSGRLAELIDLESGKIKALDLDKPKQAALACWRHDYLKESCLPKSFVEKFSETASKSLDAWHQAYQNDDFSHFAPHLKKVIEHVRKKADYLGYQDHPYDALLEIYEPGVATKEIESVFSFLKPALKDLIKKASLRRQVDSSFLFGDFPKESQMAFGKQLLQDIGYDFSKGRLDLSCHPFSSAAHPSDSRITTRIHKTSLMSSIFSILHEAGHGLYEMGLDAKEYGSPLCEAVSFGMHESQSRWWEILIGQTKPFWQYYLPLLKQEFKNKFDHVSLDDFYCAVTQASPSFVRVEADELTYPMHIILRFEIEKELIEGSLNVSDLPAAWNEKMQMLLGITPETNKDGCLQDIHWAGGDFGYFPSYALGNMYASHLFLGFERDHPDWKENVSSGNFLFIKEWLHEVVYKHGRALSSREILLKATGKPFSPQAYLNHLTNKYLT